MRAGCFLNLPSNTHRSIKNYLSQKKSGGEPELLNGSFDYDGFSIYFQI